MMSSATPISIASLRDVESNGLNGSTAIEAGRPLVGFLRISQAVPAATASAAAPTPASRARRETVCESATDTGGSTTGSASGTGRASVDGGNAEGMGLATLGSGPRSTTGFTSPTN